MNTTAVQSDALARVLRLSEEPCVYYSEQTIHQELMNGLRAFMDALECFYFAWSRDTATVTQPPKHVFQRAGVRGDWRVMPCAIDHRWPITGDAGRSIDAVKIIGTNEEDRVVADKISVGKAILLHPTDHFVEAIFDVAALSSFRTAAISVLAYKHCGYRSGHIAGIIGAGRVGFYTARILQEWLGIEQLLVYDVNKSRARDFFHAVTERHGAQAQVASLPEVRSESQALFLATTSQRPLINGRLEGHGSFISSVGADADNLSELDADVLDGRMLVSESLDNLACGDLRRWHEAGIIRSRDLVLLSVLMRDSGNGTPVSRPVVFVSTGTAVQDALVCRFLHDRLRGRGGLPMHASPAAPQ